MSMLIRILQDLFSKTVGNKQQETTITTTPPAETAKESESEPSVNGVDKDVALLTKRYGDLHGLTIEIQLQKILTIVPRKRQRADAYKSLVGYLRREYDCKLIINSRKHKKNGQIKQDDIQ